MWENDQRQGKGKIKKSNGDCYEADFDKNELAGEVFSKIG
jgi:hypothetical protein